MAKSFGSGGWSMKVTGIDATKQLFDRISVNFDGSTVYVVGPMVEYGVYNELGTSRMEARPFMQPAAERVDANIATYAQQFADGPLESEEQIVASVALAVEAEAKKIADAKDIRDTGALINSIEARPVS